MARLLRLPKRALDDVVALVSLDTNQLHALDELFSTKESAALDSESFIDKVTEKLGIDDARALSVLAVTSFVLRMLSSGASASQAVDELREFVEENADDQQRETLVASIDANRPVLESLATAKPERLRGIKIRKLAEEPEHKAESFRTICQLRPLFEGPKEHEQIVGLVPTVLMELKLARSDDNRTETITFNLSREQLNDLREVIERTAKKIDAIQQKYGDGLLTLD